MRSSWRLARWIRASVAAGSVVLATTMGGAASAAAAAPMTLAQIQALGGHLYAWQVLWLETGGASGVPGLVPPSGPLSPPAGAPPVLGTMVSTYVPANFQPTQTVSGSCWTGSIAAPRAGAYRCSAGNSILDPCFALAGTGEAACPSGNPVDQTGTLIRLTAPLPAGNTGQPRPEHPWYFTLQDGGTCGALTGTLVAPDHPYGCLVPASASSPRLSVYCTAPAPQGPLYTVGCAALSSQRAPNGAPRLGADTSHKVGRIWT